MTVLHRILTMFLVLLQIFLGGFSRTPMELTQVKPEKGTMEIANKNESDLCTTAEYAANIKNTVQASYTDKNRSSYRISNTNAVFTHALTSLSKTASLTSPDGNIYAENTFESFYYDRVGTRYYFESSVQNARINTIRLGEYYYECHVRDLARNFFKVDKIYHAYGDRLYMQYTLLSSVATTVVGGFGSEINIPVENVAAFEVKDKNGIHRDLNFDSQTVEYVAFDIKNAGIVGFIIPADGSTSALTVRSGLSMFTVTQYAAFVPGTGINDNNEKGGYDLNGITFGCRIYTDTTHSFDGVAKASKEEREPLTVTIGETNTADAEYLGYDALRGAYTLTLNGTDFQTAYDNPDMRFTVPITVYGDDTDRIVYIRANGSSGCLEAAALLDSEDVLMPIDVEVCKNFSGDGGEPFYSPMDYAYGDSIFPLYVKTEAPLSMKLLNLYQNWGNFPLKQLSSIEFHVSYYHLSTGTTESNCIAPYFVFGKDGWTLPDFRNRSGDIWSDQPQFNSVGILKFMSHTENKKNNVFSEFTGSMIDSCGLTYADVTDHYTDDDGKYTYSVRHVEMPQTDENRTYYTLKVDFIDDVTYDNFMRDFDIFYFDGRSVNFKEAIWLNEQNECVSSNVASGSAPVYHTLGTDGAYMGFYGITDDTAAQIDNRFGCNFALIIKNSKIISNGEILDKPFVFRENPSKKYTSGSLTLDAEKLSFKKGDSMEINMILLPWGTGLETTAENVIHVRQDSVLSPVQLRVLTGTDESDAYLPIVRCDNNRAEFTVYGGKNNIAVTVKGFDSLQPPTICIKENESWKKYEPASAYGYDGYSVKVEPDGTYSFSFIFESNGSDSYTFKVEKG